MIAITSASTVINMILGGFVIDMTPRGRFGDDCCCELLMKLTLLRVILAVSLVMANVSMTLMILMPESQQRRQRA